MGRRSKWTGIGKEISMPVCRELGVQDGSTRQIRAEFQMGITQLHMQDTDCVCRNRTYSIQEADEPRRKRPRRHAEQILEWRSRME